MTRRVGTGSTGKRKRTTTVTEEIPENAPLGGEDDLQEIDVSLEEVQDVETLNAVLNQYGVEEQVNFKIYKMIDGVQQFVFQNPKLDEEFIQRTRGGGMYFARLFINGKFKRSLQVPIADLPDSEKPQNGNGGGGHQAFLEKMLMALILKEGQSSAAPSLTDLTTALTNLDSMRGKQENAVDLLLKGMTMARELGDGGPADWKTEMMRLAKDNLPGVVSVVQQAIAAKNGQPVVPGPGPTPAVQTTLNPEEQEMQRLGFMFKQAIGMLKTQFMMGLDSESALALILANAGNPSYQPLIQQFATMEFDELVALDADIGKEPFNLRFRTLHDGLRSALSEEDSMEPDSSGGPRNVDDVRRHGKPS